MIELIRQLITDLFAHRLDETIKTWAGEYHNFTYLILFIIIFMETGVVVTPFLPGDSLLFATGMVAAQEGHPLSIFVLIPLLLCAAFGGDNTNYVLGKRLGKGVYEKNYRLIRRDYLDKTHAFYEKHGGKTLIIARFMPIIRTFAPFVAGIGTMSYLRFISFSIAGNVLWVVSLSLAGYFLGTTEFVKNHFTEVIFGIIFVSLLPMIIALVKKFLSKPATK